MGFSFVLYIFTTKNYYSPKQMILTISVHVTFLLFPFGLQFIVPKTQLTRIPRPNRDNTSTDKSRETEFSPPVFVIEGLLSVIISLSVRRTFTLSTNTPHPRLLRRVLITG